MIKKKNNLNNKKIWLNLIPKNLYFSIKKKEILLIKYKQFSNSIIYWNKFFIYLLYQMNYLKLLNLFNKKYLICTKKYNKYKKIKFISTITQNFFLFGFWPSGLLTNIIWYKFLPLTVISIEITTIRQLFIENSVSKIPTFLFNSQIDPINILNIQKKNPWLFSIPMGGYTKALIIIFLFSYLNLIKNIEKIFIFNIFLYKNIYKKTTFFYKWIKNLKRNKVFLITTHSKLLFSYKKINKYLRDKKKYTLKFLDFILLNFIWTINIKKTYKIKRYFWLLYPNKNLILKKKQQNIQITFQLKKVSIFLLKKITQKRKEDIIKTLELLKTWLNVQYL